MLYSLGFYRCQHGLSPARQDNIFLIPLLTGTTREGASLKLSQFKISPLSLLPLKLESSLSILMKELGSSPLLTNRQFHCFLQDLGIVPRYLEWLVNAIRSLNIDREWTSPQNHNHSIVAFAANLLKDEDFGVPGLIGALGGVDSPDAHTFLLWCLSSREVSWDDMIHGVTLEHLGQRGNIFLAEDASGTICLIFCIFPDRVGRSSLYLPGLLVNLFAKKLRLHTMQRITYFPPQHDWEAFELLCVSLMVARINLVVASGRKECLLSELFPGAVLSGSAAPHMDELRFSLAGTYHVYQEVTQWVTSTSLDTSKSLKAFPVDQGQGTQ